jgi:hypothetical protein
MKYEVFVTSNAVQIHDVATGEIIARMGSGRGSLSESNRRILAHEARLIVELRNQYENSSRVASTKIKTDPKPVSIKPTNLEDIYAPLGNH